MYILVGVDLAVLNTNFENGFSKFGGAVFISGCKCIIFRFIESNCSFSKCIFKYNRAQGGGAIMA